MIGLALYNTVVIAEILRSGMEGLPRGQREAAERDRPEHRSRPSGLILLPQAFRIMLPALISQLVVVLKDTSLGFIISYEEILRVTSQIVQVLDNPIQMYMVVGSDLHPDQLRLSKLAGYTQRRMARGRKTRNLPTEAPPAAVAVTTGV